MARKGWNHEEEKLLINNYNIKTIIELMDMFTAIKKHRNANSINAKIKRLKADGKIKGTKTENTIKRSLIQRRR